MVPQCVGPAAAAGGPVEQWDGRSKLPGFPGTRPHPTLPCLALALPCSHAAPQDHDGSHIKGLIMNYFHHFYPSLLKLPGFLVEFITPIIKVGAAPLRRA